MAFYKGNPDIIIRNGTIVDGTGKLPYFADIAIKGDKIDYIGNLKGVSAPSSTPTTSPTTPSSTIPIVRTPFARASPPVW